MSCVSVTVIAVEVDLLFCDQLLSPAVSLRGLFTRVCMRRVMRHGPDPSVNIGPALDVASGPIWSSAVFPGHFRAVQL